MEARHYRYIRNSRCRPYAYGKHQILVTASTSTNKLIKTKLVTREESVTSEDKVYLSEAAGVFL